MSSIEITGGIQRGEFDLQIDVQIPPGLTTITGPNGAGKTSLLRLIAGLERLNFGRLDISGRVVDGDHFVPAYGRNVSVAFQDHRLFPHLSALDNVAFPLRRQGMRRAAARAAALPHLEAFGLGDEAAANATQLSIGQQQRTALARALATRAEVLLLDEPLASVDEETRQLVRNCLSTLQHRYVLWVTHDSLDAATGDHRIAVDNGRVEQNQR